jgi:hypothetical protein
LLYGELLVEVILILSRCSRNWRRYFVPVVQSEGFLVVKRHAEDEGYVDSIEKRGK